MKPIDLRSDTVTQPTPAMRRAMAEAEVGDDVYGEDPTVRRLEERVAERLGLEAGALRARRARRPTRSPSACTAARATRCIAEDGQPHLPLRGRRGAGAVGRAAARRLPGERGLLDAASRSTAAVRADNIHVPRTRLLSLENTHNRGGGTVWPLERFRAVVAAARKARARGAPGRRAPLQRRGGRGRAGVARGRALTDSTTVCFSKGLGAPVGSVLAGTADVHRARRGGCASGWAAACARRASSRRRRSTRWSTTWRGSPRTTPTRAGWPRGWRSCPGVKVDPARVETNMVFAELPAPGGGGGSALLADAGRAGQPRRGPHSVRLCDHLDVSTADIDEALARIRKASQLTAAQGPLDVGLIPRERVSRRAERGPARVCIPCVRRPAVAAPSSPACAALAPRAAEDELRRSCMPGLVLARRARPASAPCWPPAATPRAEDAPGAARPARAPQRWPASRTTVAPELPSAALRRASRTQARAYREKVQRGSAMPADQARNWAAMNATLDAFLPGRWRARTAAT